MLRSGSDERYRRHRLLCSRTKRPPHHATDPTDELAPPQLLPPSARGYAITSLARTRRAVGTVRPSALAVLRLISNSYLAGACTGNSPGLSPFRTRSTYEAERRTISSGSGPYEISPPPLTKFRRP